MDPACILDQAKEKKQTSTGGETNGQNRNVPEKKGWWELKLGILHNYCWSASL